MRLPSAAALLGCLAALLAAGAGSPVAAEDKDTTPPGVTALPPGTGATPTKAPARIQLDAGPAPATPSPQDAAYGAYQRGQFKTALGLAVERARAQDDPIAMVLAGELLSQGYGVRQDSTAAREWFEAAAAKGNADALFTLGSMKLISGEGAEKTEAIDLLRQAGEKGNVAAAYNLGLVYLQGELAPREPAIAADWFRRAADKDQPDAIYALATLYRDGNGVPKDPREAARLLMRADQLGNVVATTELAIMVFNGDGVPKDEARAATLFHKAALAGNPIAQNRYARILSAGRGVPVDKVSAAAWYLAAKAQKLDDLMLGQMVSELTPEERASLETRIKTWTVPETQPQAP
ncbi:tetratricopeptide repeat protein [Ancylobacter amanitiformis]|uniref:TPR repeat protein n=1 Tax=Ancylobacter amanitiformis TaxID=217069 RepID=A0ABU0LNL4_9HYPH|nr:tetratricopeptide repeat protein [Ancylobacter amanitiformis]MDQ0510293.1 TPR repeat protein [Ancylobacter amanitiformis]